MTTAIEEQHVGIHCYISNLPGFRGILKQRYSDFIVHEVDLEGNVVRLTSLLPPPELMVEEQVKLSDQPNQNWDSEIQLFESLAGACDAEKLKGYIDQINLGTEDGASPIVLAPSSDKSHRTAVHNFFKEKMKFLVTDTVDGPDESSKCIRVRVNVGQKGGERGSRKRKDRSGKPFDSRGSDDWVGSNGKFLRFNLYKENKETHECIALIGKMLGVQPRSFGFAGTKDKRSVSTQRVTVFKQRANKLAALNNRLIGIKVGDFCYVNEGLVLGKLLGNRFTITLRGVIADCDNTIKASADSLGRHGFINYFGLQRFGSGSVPTHLIGAALLRGEWDAAVSMILDPRDGEREYINKAREYYKESGDIQGTLRQLPKNMFAERAVLMSLKNDPRNSLLALTAIPRTLRMMYVHSYQSFLWNNAASARVKKYGINQVVLGDLVYCKDNIPENNAEVIISCCEATNSDNVDLDAFEEVPDIGLPSGKKSPVKAINAEDIDSGKYTIEDVLLPLPGSRVKFPENEVAEIYHNLANKDGIKLTESPHNVKDFSITNMTGDYRCVFQKPKDFEFELLEYIDGNAPLAETDLDRIEKLRSGNRVVEDGQADVGEDTNGHSSDPIIRDTQKALKLCFTLPSSSYATMAIRELLKTSTSVAFHKTLND
uniref:TRUD domain-containing protein n=1 Tax=Kalanchoe fedtschenkoi TaxID=63787 RepID=A0A7N0UDF1_KALFE